MKLTRSLLLGTAAGFAAVAGAQASATAGEGAFKESTGVERQETQS